MGLGRWEEPGGVNTLCHLSSNSRWCLALVGASRELEGKLALWYSP